VAAAGELPPPRDVNRAIFRPCGAGTSVKIARTDFTNGVEVNTGSAPVTVVKWTSKALMSATGLQSKPELRSASGQTPPAPAPLVRHPAHQRKTCSSDFLPPARDFVCPMPGFIMRLVTKSSKIVT